MPPDTEQTARVLDGRALARDVKSAVRDRVAALRARGRPVRLDAILVGGAGASAVYARNQESLCEELGLDHTLHELDMDATQAEVERLVARLNGDPAVSAIMAFLPLPKHLDTERLQSLIDPAKDAEGVNPANIGNVVYGRRSLVPCTALATMVLLESTGIHLPGTRCVCVGASNIVGKPVAVLLMRAEATVISTNVHTPDIATLTRSADVLITAAGVPGLITADLVKPGAVVIDVGINRVKGPDGKTHTVGDVAFDEVSKVAGWISPVPGGVGPMTVAMLLRNTVDAAER